MPKDEGYSKKKKTIKHKKKEVFKKFTRRLDKNLSIKYVWNKMRVLKNRLNTVEWNKWQGRNRELEIDNTIEKLASLWAAENPDLNFSHRNGLHNDNDTSRLDK